MVTIPDTVRRRARVLSAHRHAVSAGACWFLGMMLLVAGSTAAAQGAVMIGAMWYSPDSRPALAAVALMN
jgi:hypothetical protein